MTEKRKTQRLKDLTKKQNKKYGIANLQFAKIIISAKHDSIHQLVMSKTTFTSFRKYDLKNIFFYKLLFNQILFLNYYLLLK